MMDLHPESVWMLVSHNAREARINDFIASGDIERVAWYHVSVQAKRGSDADIAHEVKDVAACVKRVLALLDAASIAASVKGPETAKLLMDAAAEADHLSGRLAGQIRHLAR